MNKKYNDVLCQYCVNHYIISGCDTCGKCHPKWVVKGEQFICYDYEEEKEIKDDEEA